MRYYVVTDIHSFFKQMKSALEEKGYFKDNGPKKLIICGDLFDRGPQPKELEKFILKLLENDESATVVCRYTEFNIAGDSIQSSNDNTATTENYQQLMNVSKSYGTITATFDSKGMMGQLYGTKVPSAWIFPLQFVNLGRYDGNDIALVRIIAPSTEGQDDAYSNVYPCFYEITYMRGDR